MFASCRLFAVSMMTIETPPLPLPLKGLLFIHFGSYFVELKYLKQDATQEEVEVQ